MLLFGGKNFLFGGNNHFTSSVSVILGELNPSSDFHRELISNLNAISGSFRQRSPATFLFSPRKLAAPSEVLLFSEEIYAAISGSRLAQQDKKRLLGEKYFEFYSRCLCEMAEYGKMRCR